MTFNMYNIAQSRLLDIPYKYMLGSIDKEQLISKERKYYTTQK